MFLILETRVEDGRLPELKVRRWTSRSFFARQDVEGHCRRRHVSPERRKVDVVVVGEEEVDYLTVFV